MGNVIIYGAVAGIVGTLIGGLISAFLGKKDTIVSVLFCVAAGVMLAIVCFDLIPEALKLGGLLSLALSVLGGGLLVVLLDEIIKVMSPKFEKAERLKAAKQQPEVLEPVETPEVVSAPVFEGDSAGAKRKSEMMRAGILMMLAIAMHNLPEGLVIGSSEVQSKGLLMMTLIGLHNIPEGIAVAAPLIAGGMKRTKAVLITGATGIPTLIGAIIGYYIGMESQLFISVSLGVAAGAMLCIIFSDMIPEAQKMYDNKIAGYATFISVLVGAVLIYAFA